ncbi:MAG: OmpA family protein [Verrucomicrobiota bacterium]
MTKTAWMIFGILAVAVVLGFIGVAAWQRGRAAEALKLELTRALATAEQKQTQSATLKEEINANKARIEELQREKEAASQAQKSLEQEMRAALESKEITISELQGKLTVNILDRIMFDSGEAELKMEGEKILQKMAGVLAEYPRRQIHVIGHTDNVPIRASARSRFPSNWELSTARATAAVRFLCEKAGVDARRLGAVGYGEFHPIADNASPDGRAKNRRIALVVLSEELVGADTLDTNAPPSTPVREKAEP